MSADLQRHRDNLQEVRDNLVKARRCFRIALGFQAVALAAILLAIVHVLGAF